MNDADGSDELQIFHDPLLTLIALILLGSVWMLLPREGPNVSIPGADHGTARQQEENASARAEFNRMKRELARLQALVQTRVKDLDALQRRLEEARQKADEARQLQALEKRIRALRDEAVSKEAMLQKAEQRLKDLRRQDEETARNAERERDRLARMQAQIATKRLALSRLEADRSSLQATLSRRSGIGVYSKERVEGKQEVGFEAAQGQIFVVNQANYDERSFVTMRGGQMAIVAEVLRKGSATGETVDALARPDSAFRKAVAAAKPESDYLFFVVRSDSFDVFLKAREIAWEKGFAVAWRPWKGPMYKGPGGGGKEGR